jgi:DNA polymerase III epsilon subunit family exonuclease
MGDVHRPVPESVPFAVVDVETTGFSPRLHDRVVEIAVVRLSRTGGPAEEYTTLVNPGRDVGPTHIHGITATDVQDAPGFHQIAGDVGRLLEGAILVAHNLRFDRSFLDAEFGRVFRQWPALPGICTLELAYRLEPQSPSRKLSECCARLGIMRDRSHCALDDARATAQLLTAYLKMAASRGVAGLPALGCWPLEMPPPGWLNLPPTGRSWCRRAAAEVLRQERGYLAHLVERLAGTEAPDARTGAYLDLLDRVLEDRRITKAEAEALIATASEWGLSRPQIQEAHRAYLGELVQVALLDDVVSRSERDDLEAVRDMLGQPASVLDVLLAQPPPPAAARSDARSQCELAGQSVCFTGALSASYRGEPITREQAEELARGAGLQILNGVTRRLDVLVVADPNTMSSKARKAREYGVRILAEAAFWRAIGVQME